MIYTSIVGVVSICWLLYCVYGLFSLRKEAREFKEIQKREAELLKELDTLQKRVTEWERQYPAGSNVDFPQSQEIFVEALRLQMCLREIHPDYDGGDKTEFLLSVIKPKGAA